MSNTLFWDPLSCIICRRFDRYLRRYGTFVVSDNQRNRGPILPVYITCGKYNVYVFVSHFLYSVRGLERSELGGSHGCPGRLWDRFLWQVYQNDNRHNVLDGVETCHKNRSQRRPAQPWDPPNSLRSKPRTEYTLTRQISVVGFVILEFLVDLGGRRFAWDVGHIVGPLNYSRCDTKHRLPCTITPFYKCYNGTSRL